jgi:type II secretory pathway component PulF
MSAPKVRLSALSLKELIDFTNTFKTLLQTGIPVIEGLVFLEKEAVSPRIKLLSREIRKQVIAGATFADTVAKYQELFGRIYVGLTKAGEDSGEMEKTLGRLSELLKKQDATKSKIIGTLIYPCFVILLAAIVVTVMLMFVFPKFKEMFERSGAELPFFTKVCIDLGEFLKEYWAITIITPFLLGYLIYWAFRNPTTRKMLDSFFIQVPLIGDMLKYANFSNFITVMHVAYEAGIPIVDCLHLGNLTIDNATIHKRVSEAVTKVQQGTHLSTALRSVDIMPSMVLFMIATGEQTGKLGELLYQAVIFLDKKLDDIVESLTQMIEPLMLIVIGAIVMFLALALYLPLFQAYQN